VVPASGKVVLAVYVILKLISETVHNAVSIKLQYIQVERCSNELQRRLKTPSTHSQIKGE
jgi:hypothetical protein